MQPPTTPPSLPPLTPGERETAIAKYQADRAHELEMDRAAGAYEQAYFKGLFALNGGSAAAFVALQGKDMPLLVSSPRLAWGALACWLLGVIVAYVAGWIAYEAQKKFAAAMRARRHAVALRLYGRHEQAVLGTSPDDTPESLKRVAEARQGDGDDGWTSAILIGLGSVVLFAVGAVLAALAVADVQMG